MPQPLLNSVSFDPPLPPLKSQLIQRMPLGSSIKTITFYKKAFWREKGLNGMVISDSGPAHISVDDTKPDGSCPAIMRYKVWKDISRNYIVIVRFKNQTQSTINLISRKNCRLTILTSWSQRPTGEFKFQDVTWYATVITIIICVRQCGMFF